MTDRRKERLTAIGQSVKARYEERKKATARNVDQADLDFLFERVMRTIAVLIQEEEK